MCEGVCVKNYMEPQKSPKSFCNYPSHNYQTDSCTGTVVTSQFYFLREDLDGDTFFQEIKQYICICSNCYSVCSSRKL